MTRFPSGVAESGRVNHDWHACALGSVYAESYCREPFLNSTPCGYTFGWIRLIYSSSIISAWQRQRSLLPSPHMKPSLKSCFLFSCLPYLNPNLLWYKNALNLSSIHLWEPFKIYGGKHINLAKIHRPKKKKDEGIYTIKTDFYFTNYECYKAYCFRRNACICQCVSLKNNKAIHISFPCSKLREP